MIGRRGFITGLVSFVAAPAIVRVGSLMPVKVMGFDPAVLIEALVDHVSRQINPPYGISPGLRALQYLDEHDRIMSVIISDEAYYVA